MRLVIWDAIVPIMKYSHVLSSSWLFIMFATGVLFFHCIVNWNGDRKLGQYCYKEWFVAWQLQTITSINVDLSSVRLYFIQLTMVQQEMLSLKQLSFIHVWIWKLIIQVYCHISQVAVRKSRSWFGARIDPFVDEPGIRQLSVCHVIAPF